MLRLSTLSAYRPCLLCLPRSALRTCCSAVLLVLTCWILILSSLLCPMRLPTCCDVHAVQMYMLLIILLMLSQDSAFAQNIHRIRLPAVPVYKERSTATTLGSLLVVLLLR